MNQRQKEILQAQLDSEKAVLKKLEKNYQNALDEINSKIELLMARQDADMQHVIYQVEYQKALKTQVQAILETLQANEFETVSEYLAQSYEDGFIGTMYDLQGQGIPLVFPIDQEQVVAAITQDTKLSEPLYESMGHDITTLKRKITSEISRGLSSGQMYSEISRNVASWAAIPKNNAMRIARTEGHRIQIQATANAQHKAKEKGADIVKQWDASLDGRTRKNHRKLDGQIRELDDPFEVNGKKAMHPGGFGRPEEDINCRCALLQRARWALGGEYTKWSEDAPVEIDDDGTTQFTIVEADNLKEFTNKYKQASERVRENAQKMNDEDEEDIFKNIKAKIMNKVNEHEPISFPELQSKYKEELLDIVSAAPNNVRTLTNKYADNVFFVNEKNIGQNRSTKNGIYVNFENDKVNEKGKWTSTFHEIAHQIDRATEGASYKDKNFKDSLQNDFENLVKEYQKLYNVNILKAYEEIGESLQEAKYHSISDIIGGITNNKCVGKYGHFIEGYWDEPHKLEKEAFAHFYEATIRNDTEKLEAIKAVFPNAYKEFEKVVASLK